MPVVIYQMNNLKFVIQFPLSNMENIQYFHPKEHKSHCNSAQYDTALQTARDPFTTMV